MDATESLLFRGTSFAHSRNHTMSCPCCKLNKDGPYQVLRKGNCALDLSQNPSRATRTCLLYGFLNFVLAAPFLLSPSWRAALYQVGPYIISDGEPTASTCTEKHGFSRACLHLIRTHIAYRSEQAYCMISVYCTVSQSLSVPYYATKSD